MTNAPPKVGALYVLDPLPFAPKRFFWIAAPQGATRGGHAHRTNEQLLACLLGGIDVHLTWWERGMKRLRTDHLKPGMSLYTAPLVWVDIVFQTDGLLAVLASEPYSEASYIRDLKQLETMSCPH